MKINQLFIRLVTVYQRAKRLLGMPPSCRFTPSCSEYFKQALRRHGIIRGSALGINRILRCHPWNAGGYNPVPHKAKD